MRVWAHGHNGRIRCCLGVARHQFGSLSLERMTTGVLRRYDGSEVGKAAPNVLLELGSLNVDIALDGNYVGRSDRLIGVEI